MFCLFNILIMSGLRFLRIFNRTVQKCLLLLSTDRRLWLLSKELDVFFFGYTAIFRVIVAIIRFIASKQNTRLFLYSFWLIMSDKFEDSKDVKIVGSYQIDLWLILSRIEKKLHKIIVIFPQHYCNKKWNKNVLRRTSEHLASKVWFVKN